MIDRRKATRPAAKNRTSATEALSDAYKEAVSGKSDTEEPSLTVQTVPKPQTVSIKRISLNPNQPRRYFDPAKHAALVESITWDGILQPLLVRPKGKGYELVAGERRYRAAQELKLPEVPVTVRDLSDIQARQYALTENLQREDLNPIEETEGILALLSMRLGVNREEVITLLHRMANKKRGLTDNVIREEDSDAVNEVFASVGRLTPESFRVNRLPLLNLPDDILDALRTGQIEYTKAKAIAQVKDEAARAELLTEAIEQALSLAQIKQKVTALKTPVAEEAPGAEDLQKRVAKLGRLSKRPEALEDPHTRQKVDKLLAQLEKLLSSK